MVKPIMKMYLSSDRNPSRRQRKICRMGKDTARHTGSKPRGMRRHGGKLIGVKKRIIIVNAGFRDIIMFNPVIVRKSGPYETEEGCLSLPGVRKTKRYQNIEIEYYDWNWKKQRQKFHRLASPDLPA